LNIHVTSIASALGNYCEIEAWIRAKFHIKKPTSDVMLLGSITHHLLEVIDGGIKIDKVNTVAKISDILTEKLIDSYNEYQKEYPDNDYGAIEARVIDYIYCLAYRFTSRYYKLQLLGKEYKSDWVVEESFHHFYKIGKTTVRLSGRIDRYKMIPDNKCVIADYKTSANPKLNDTMRIQLDGYALLLHEKYGVETVMAQIDFPLYQITEYYIPNKDQYRDVYLPLYLETMQRDTLPPYYPRTSCTYCEDVVRKKCLELRPK
jgi:CRISPR/Cas system-associated exonuclease Cas4 (RecB family)